MKLVLFFFWAGEYIKRSQYYLICPRLAKNIYSDTNESRQVEKIDLLPILFSSEWAGSHAEIFRLLRKSAKIYFSELGA